MAAVVVEVTEVVADTAWEVEEPSIAADLVVVEASTVSIAALVSTALV